MYFISQSSYGASTAPSKVPIGEDGAVLDARAPQLMPLVTDLIDAISEEWRKDQAVGTRYHWTLLNVAVSDFVPLSAPYEHRGPIQGFLQPSPLARAPSSKPSGSEVMETLFQPTAQGVPQIASKSTELDTGPGSKEANSIRSQKPNTVNEGQRTEKAREAREDISNIAREPPHKFDSGSKPRLPHVWKLDLVSLGWNPSVVDNGAPQSLMLNGTGCKMAPLPPEGLLLSEQFTGSESIVVHTTLETQPFALAHPCFRALPPIVQWELARQQMMKEEFG